MIRILTAATLALLPSIVLAGGHAGMGGIGTGITSDNQVMEGKTGVLVKKTTNDVWIWDNPPEGFHKATAATCTQVLTFAAGQEQPIGYNGICMSVDPDGDVAVSLLTPHPEGALITQTSGTGKWEAYNGIKFIGKTTNQIDPNTTTYSWTPTE